MLYKLRQRAQDERGFTLIELLVVILIIGILAAIVIPSFLNQKGKAVDAAAKELAHAAQTAAETFATDNNGSYANLTPAVLATYESTIQVGSTANNNNAYIQNVNTIAGAIGTANTYTVTATSTNGDTFSISRTATGTVNRTCTTATGNTPTGCTAASASW